MKTSLLLMLMMTSSCSISRPCSEGGDVSWNPKIIGDKLCTQKTLPDGRVVNQGKFKQAYQSNGNIALEGQFEEGRKQGVWTYYGEDAQLRAVKYYEKGVEKTPPLEVQKQIDLIIQQKTNKK